MRRRDDEDATEREVARVVEERMDRAKPIAVEEALLMLEDAARPFIIFRDSANDRIGVVYRRQDGRYGLIQPRP